MPFDKVKDSERKNGIVSDDLEEYILDSVADIDNVPTTCAPGSVA